MKFTRITVDAQQMGGVPCIRGLRIPLATVVDMVADGMAAAEILKAYPDLVAADIHEALHYAAEAVRERGLPRETTRYSREYEEAMRAALAGKPLALKGPAERYLTREEVNDRAALRRR